MIATGFNREAVSAAAQQSNNGAEIISYDEWVNLNKGLGKSPGLLRSGENAAAESVEDLSVPTVLRRRQQRDGNGRDSQAATS